MKKETKMCTLCKDELPATLEYFHRNCGQKNGLAPRCKICASVTSKLLRQKNREKINKRKREIFHRDKKKIKKQREILLNSEVKVEARAFINISLYEDVRVDPKDSNLCQVKCFYCGKWFNPTLRKCRVRDKAVTGDGGTRGECRIYCSDNCKQSCPTYGQISYPKGFKKSSSREVNTVLRKIVLERDGYKCQKCGATTKEMQLHVHHIKSFTQDTIFADDPDNCITLCKKCHKQIHKQEGCTYNELRCKA